MLWLDRGLDPDTVMDAPPMVVAALVGLIQRRAEQAEEEGRRRAHQEDMAQAARMLQTLKGVG